MTGPLSHLFATNENTAVAMVDDERAFQRGEAVAAGGFLERRAARLAAGKASKV